MIITVGERLSSYTKREKIGISKVIDLQRSLGYASRKELISAIRNGVIVDCPIIVQDVERTEYVYGKSAPKLKGKSTAF